MVLTGVRWGESARRSKRRMNETCFKDGSKRYLHPIIDWTTDDIWNYIRANGIRYCSLYDEGFERLGCVGCPMASTGRAKQFERWPAFKRAYIKAFQRMLEGRKERELPTKWTTGEEVFDWWMKDKRKPKPDENQKVFIFED